MDLVGLKPYISCSGSIKMQAEYPKYPLHLGPHSREDAVPSLLPTTQAPVAPGDEDFEHHDRVVGFTANLGGMQRTKDFLERFPIDEFIDASEDIFWKILVYEVFTYGELAAIFLEH